MVNPVEAIARTRNRLARLAALRAGLSGSLPIIITLATAFSLDLIGSLMLDQWGYMLDPTAEMVLLEGVLGLVVVQVVLTAFLGWRAWRRARDFIAAAEQIDERIGCHQEVLTLATLTDPAQAQARTERSPLFPMLWRRAIAYLEPFDPRREFRAEIFGPLRRSSLWGLATIVVLGLALVAAMRIPTPLQLTSHRLQQLARTLDQAKPAAQDRQLAAASRDVARDLLNPKLPPEQKIAELQSLKQEIEKFQAHQQNASGSSSGSSGSGKGEGNGNGNGQGAGKGKGAGGSGAGTGSAAQNGKGKKGDQQIAELQNDITKAQMKLEDESKSPDKSQTAKNDNGKGNGSAPTPGDNPNQAGTQRQPNGVGNVKLPEPASLAKNQTSSGNNPSGQKNDKGSQGDTHLGEMPKPVTFERFYKLGEKGPALDIRDARFVTFRLPTEIVGNGGGKSVPDSARPVATTPYTNAPLKQERLAVLPDEQQLIPPRYRDLIH